MMPLFELTQNTPNYVINFFFQQAADFFKRRR